MEQIQSGYETKLPMRIGNYRVIRRLVEGEDIFLVRDERLGRMLVTKRVIYGPGARGFDRRRLRRDVAAVSGLRHPVVVTTHGLLEDGRDEYLVTDFAPGRTIGARLREEALSEAVIVNVAQQLVLGIGAGHEHGIVHRDLGAEHVVLSDDGRAHILAFGLGRRLPSRDLQEGGAEVLAARFRTHSPESIRGDRVDHRSDLFSLGALLYEMVTRTSPFQGRNMAETAQRIQHQHHKPLAQVFPGVHARFSVMVDWLLQKDPDRRPEAASELMPLLDEVGADITGAIPLPAMEIPLAATAPEGAGPFRVEMVADLQDEEELPPQSADPTPSTRRLWLGMVLVLLCGALAYFWLG